MVIHHIEDKRKRMKYKNHISRCILMCLLCMSGLTGYAADNDDIIEFQGDRYVIHVDKMNPDTEMTLLDVLNTCPEYFSTNGKKIDQNYKLRVDNIDLIMDPESFLANVKAREIDRIQICSNTSVAKAVSGTKGIIDIYYREDVKSSGKVALRGNTYGNGMAYADITKRSEKLSVQAYALARTSYGKSYPLEIQRMTDRGLAENMHLSLDWKISDSDRLFVKMFQTFENTKQKLFDPVQIDEDLSYNRYVALVLSYSHTFKNDAILFAEAGSDYTNNNADGSLQRITYPYGFVELNTPLFTPDLWLMVGTEMDYENTWHVNLRRDQLYQIDFYAQLDYTHGPWVLTLGDRFRIMNYWSRLYQSADQSLWKHSRNNHSYLASVGYKTGRHFVQALFTRRFFVPEVIEFLADETASTVDRIFNAGNISTNIVHQGALRYTYQTKNFFVHTSIENNWYTHLAGPNNQQLGIRNSMFWRTGPWELTLGANYYYEHRNADKDIAADNEHYVALKLAPVLNLPHGWRLSSTLLYSSRRSMNDIHPHLFATAKVNKQFGKMLNVFAEFHDISGYATGYWLQQAYCYQNRALSVGATVYLK